MDAGFDVNADSDLLSNVDSNTPEEDEFWYLKLYCDRVSPLAVIAFFSYCDDHANALLEAGACPDAVDSDHVPPLLVALDSMNRSPLARTLVSSGASVNVYHPLVSGNLSLLVCLHFLRSLDMILRCGSEPDSLFHGVGESNTPGVAPMSFYDVVEKTQPVMTKCGVKLEQVLDRLLLFSSSVSLDDRLADYCSSESEWRRLKAVAGKFRPIQYSLCFN